MFLRKSQKPLKMRLHKSNGSMLHNGGAGVVATLVSMLVFTTAFSLPRWTASMKSLTSPPRTNGFPGGVFASSTDKFSNDPSNVLGENVHLLTDEQLGLVSRLLSLQQQHLFSGWPTLGTDDNNKVVPCINTL
jgi:hypothetical protein